MPEKIRGRDGRKLREVSHYKVVPEGINKYAGCHGDTKKEGQAA